MGKNCFYETMTHLQEICDRTLEGKNNSNLLDKVGEVYTGRFHLQAVLQTYHLGNKM